MSHVPEDNSRLNWEHDGNLLEVAKHLRDCANSWEPKVRLLGNCRAEDIALIADRYLEMYTMVEYFVKDLEDSREDLVGAKYYAKQLKRLL